MKQFIFVVLSFFWSLTSTAQSYEGYVKKHMDQEDHSFRDYKLGVIVKNENGEELRRSEPIFKKICYEPGFAFAAVSIPFTSKELGENYACENGVVWTGLNEDLTPVFFFPDDVKDVLIYKNMFLYTNVVSPSSGHWYYYGLIDTDGNVVFKAPYTRIYIENGRCVGVREKTDKDSSPDECLWSVEYKKPASGFSARLLIKTPSDAMSYGLYCEECADYLKEDIFNMALHNLVMIDFEEAKKCFKEALKSDDPSVVSCAKYNLDALEDAWL